MCGVMLYWYVEDVGVVGYVIVEVCGGVGLLYESVVLLDVVDLVGVCCVLFGVVVVDWVFVGVWFCDFVIFVFVEEEVVVYVFVLGVV